MSRPTRETDQAYMRRAISLAMRGRGIVEPNPMVGCVIVKNGRIIAEGFHALFGGPHAEIEALARCTEQTSGATAYVTLEPCCHTNKKTPPCAPRLIQAGLTRVVIGTIDPNPAVRGKGIEMIRAAGIATDTGILEPACRQLNAPFFALTKFHRPYVTLKWAQSSNGKVAGEHGKPAQISNDRSRRAVHELRSRCDALLVGINTILADDPLLTVRGVPAHRPLKRLVLDTHLRIPLDCNLVATARETPTQVFYGEDAHASQRLRIAELEERGVTCTPLPLSRGRLVLSTLMTALAQQQITHLLVEPGPTLARSFLEANLGDRVWIIRSPHPIGADSAPAAPETAFPATASRNLEGDTVTEYFNPDSEVFFESVPSADLVLIDLLG